MGRRWGVRMGHHKIQTATISFMRCSRHEVLYTFSVPSKINMRLLNSMAGSGELAGWMVSWDNWEETKVMFEWWSNWNVYKSINSCRGSSKLKSILIRNGKDLIISLLLFQYRIIQCFLIISTNKGPSKELLANNLALNNISLVGSFICRELSTWWICSQLLSYWFIAGYMLLFLVSPSHMWQMGQ